MCFFVRKDGEYYVVVHDGRGEELIYRVKELPKDGNIGEEHLTLLWSRNSV
jgi:hypothetical protein